MNKKNSPVHALVGGASIILIISVLAMAALAALSLTKANNDLIIAEEGARFLEDYYSAEAEAVLYEAQAEPGDGIEYRVPVQDGTILLLRFDKSEDGFVHVTSHTLLTDTPPVEYETGW